MLTTIMRAVCFHILSLVSAMLVPTIFPSMAPMAMCVIHSRINATALTRQFCGAQGMKQPLMIQKSDGGFGYGTTDMAAITHRVQTEKVVLALPPPPPYYRAHAAGGLRGVVRIYPAF